MKITHTNLEGCILIEPAIYTDKRGTFSETFNQQVFEKAIGRKVSFVQDNQSVSHKNVLRGLHYQEGPYAQAKLLRVVRGRVLDVAVDLRENSISFGKHTAVELSEENGLSLFIPKGFAHGFLALENQTVFQYKCDAYYHPLSEKGLIFNDPDLKIKWGVAETELLLSEKDLQLPRFKEVFP